MGVFNIISADRPWTIYKFPRELILWRDAVIANGGARPSLAEMMRRNRLIHNDMVSGAWALTDDILMSGEDEVQSLVSLKLRLLCVRYNSPPFFVESGHVLDGMAHYIEWPFIPTVHARAMTLTNKRMAIWNLLNEVKNNSAIGSASGATNRMIMRPATSDGDIDVGMNCSPVVRFPLDEVDSRGFSVASTANDTTVRGYKDGARLADQTAVVASGLSSFSFYIGTHNQSGSYDDIQACAIPYAALGAQLTDAQERATYDGVRAAVSGMFVAGDDEEEN